MSKLIAGGLAVAALLATTGVRAEMMTALGEPEGALVIVAAPGLVESGENDLAFDWVSGFEAETGCAVSVKLAQSADEMLRLVNGGGVDLAIVSSDLSRPLITARRVQEINTALIPSWFQIDARFRNAPWHTVDGKHYGTPLHWGPNVLMYSTSVFETPPTSWSVVYERRRLADGERNEGRVQGYGAPFSIADAANYLMTHRPELEIASPYELNERQYAAALDLLRAQSEVVGGYWRDAFDQTDDFRFGEMVAAMSRPFQVDLLRADGRAVDWTIPEEGATGWADAMMMPAEAPHPACGYLWMEHMLSTETQSDLAVWMSSAPVAIGACQSSETLGPDGCVRNGWKAYDRVKFWREPVASCASQVECVPYYRWVADFAALLEER